MLILQHRSSFFAISAWELQNILMCTDAQHLQKAMYDAHCWHRDMLSAISQPYEVGKVQLDLQYIRDPREHPARLRIVLLAMVKSGSHVEAANLGNELKDDLETFLLPVFGGPGHPYQWTALKDEDRMQEFLTERKGLNKRMFLRHGHVYEDRNQMQRHLPPLIPDARHLANWAFIQHRQINNTLFHALLHEDSYMELHLRLMPWKLPESTEAFLNLVRDGSLAPRERHDERWLQESLDAYLRNKDRLYLTIVELYRESAGLDNALNAAICDAFLQGHANAEVIETYRSGPLTLLDDMIPEERMPGQLSTLDNASLHWCLPLPTGTDHGAFAVVSRAMRIEPDHISGDGMLMARTGRHGNEKQVRISSKDLFQHVYIMGQTGTGKTTMLKTMIRDRLDQGDGMAVFDPHGDLYHSIKDELPQGRQEDLICFHSMDQDNSPTFNPRKFCS